MGGEVTEHAPEAHPGSEGEGGPDATDQSVGGPPPAETGADAGTVALIIILVLLGVGGLAVGGYCFLKKKKSGFGPVEISTTLTTLRKASLTTQPQFNNSGTNLVIQSYIL